MGIRTLRVNQELLPLVGPLLPGGCKIIGMVTRESHVALAISSSLFSDEEGLEIEMLVTETGLSRTIELRERPRLASDQ